MRALKILVIGMGCLIVLGFAVVAGTLAMRLFDVARGPAAEPSIAGTVALPAGARIVEMDATVDRIVLRLVLADGASRLLLVDPSTGAVTGDVRFDVSPE